MHTRYWIDARDKPALLRRMMFATAGDAHISFEGRIASHDFPANLEASTHETSSLKRVCFSPRMDFVVLPLELDTVQPILDVILPNRRYLDDIIHIQIAHADTLRFGAYDNFHRDCVVAYEGVDTNLLEELQASGVIRSWKYAPSDQHRWHD
ncbi:MAG TPA: hypothetical protein VK157_07900 [Phycisphaerales bacterium]|nr:hypothetical protein [Phycisphaerales bacterium]